MFIGQMLDVPIKKLKKCIIVKFYVASAGNLPLTPFMPGHYPPDCSQITNHFAKIVASTLEDQSESTLKQLICSPATSLLASLLCRASVQQVSLHPCATMATPLSSFDICDIFL